MSARTLAEACYMVASAIVTYLITAMAAWGYPQGGDTIWPIGLVSTAFVVGFGFKPFLLSWRADRAGRRDA
ncbi:MAG: hypothetical protein ACTHJR_01705 [Sphingomonas sp.]|uniref:hypothetical protein n=1 Tax=Sphingomonas sp. TaxID=28214 RepID=UPI003F8028C0